MGLFSTSNKSTQSNTQYVNQTTTSYDDANILGDGASIYSDASTYSYADNSVRAFTDNSLHDNSDRSVTDNRSFIDNSRDVSADIVSDALQFANAQDARYSARAVDMLANSRLQSERYSDNLLALARGGATDLRDAYTRFADDYAGFADRMSGRTIDAVVEATRTDGQQLSASMLSLAKMAAITIGVVAAVRAFA